MFRDSERDLFSATAVCRYWRRTLIFTPNLWNNIICSKQANGQVTAPRVRAYFERSGSVPVRVQIHARASRVLSSYTERISRLEIFLDHSSDLVEIAEYLSKPAPLLETIILRARNWGQHTLVLPSRFFDTFLSSARTLSLHGVTLSPGPRKLSQLTRFTLETFVISVTSAILLDTLEQMPLLQVFEAKFDRADLQDPFPRDRVVTLPHLEEITITTNEHCLAPLASPILPGLRLPSARRVTMESIRAYGVPPTPILPLSFEERLPGLSATPYALVVLDKNIIAIQFCGLCESKLTLCINSFVHCAFTQVTFGGTPFGSVRRLHVCFRGSAVDSIFFIKILRVMKGLEWLEMEWNTVWPLTCWIREGKQAEICPALITLTVADVDLDEAKRCVGDLEQVRERAGVPIARVEVTSGIVIR
ncbi:hypothetical protein BDM02DRAFT_3131713 [Thelephora ganbajun]|uniref:Uncharacterized protein n=1 Tax=Thelephora ganbajun TaxID=370292 RepID=A0ACB6Z5S7_THEGA|nr:hypothetical protein BDM02DRAFT_3131713 [Thelephora ganbajun]